MRVRRDVARALAGVDDHPPAGGQRPLVLRDLVALRQVGIEVVLAGEHRRLVHVALERQRRGQRQVDRLRVHHRQRAGQPEAHRADVGVGGGAELGAAAAEDLGRGAQLRVDLEADDGLVGDAAPRPPGSRARARGHHRGVDVAGEGLEVLDEHRRQLRRLGVVGRRVLPGAARVEHRRRHVGTAWSAPRR